MSDRPSFGRVAMRGALIVLVASILSCSTAAAPSIPASVGGAAVADAVPGRGPAELDLEVSRALAAEQARLAAEAALPDPPPLAQPVPRGGRVLPEPWADPPAAAGIRPPDVSAAAVVVLDEASASVLYELEGHARRGPASLTKIATAILAAEHGDLEAIVTSDVDGSRMARSTVMGLKPGDEFRLLDLLYGMMLPSGNDAALTIARHLAGSEEVFARRMTELAEGLGLRDTQFLNPHGLGQRGHYASAYDLAILARYMMTIPELREIAAARHWTSEGTRAIEMRTLNSLLESVPGADGVKTGYTRSSGRTIVASATRHGHRVYVVLLDAPDRERDATRLLEWAFAAHHWPDA